MSKLSLDSQYMTWTVYWSLKTNSAASDGNMKLGAHTKYYIVRLKKIKWRVLISISIHAGSTSPLHSEVDSTDYFTGIGVRPCANLYVPMRFHITLIQQQGYQHAGLVNLCPVRDNLCHNLWGHITVPPVQSVPWNGYGCSHGTLCFEGLTYSALLSYKTDGYIQLIQWGTFGMALLWQIAVSFSPTS